MNKEVGLMNVFDVVVFDENGKYIATLDKAQKSALRINGKDSYLYVKNGLLNIDLLRFMQEDSKEGTDYENVIKSFKPREVKINLFGEMKKCKIVATTKMRDFQSLIDENCIINIDDVALKNTFTIETDNNANPFDVVFQINSSPVMSIVR